MQHMQSANLGLISTRQLSTSTFQHIWVAEEAIDGNSISLQTREYTYIFPLYLYPSTEKKQSQASLFDDVGDEDAGPGGRRANLSAEFIADLTGKLGAAWVPDGRGTVSALIPQPPFGPAQDRLLPQGEKGSKEQASTVPQGEKGSKQESLPSPAAGRGAGGEGNRAGGEGNRAGGEGISVGPEDVFHYAYAVFHSPTYRSRYAELLKIDFPRLPLTGDPALFADLAALGAELVDLHLLRLPGQVPPGAVGGNGGHPALAKLRTRFQGGGANIVEKIGYDAADQRVYISKTSYFEGIDPATWEFRVGGYQVLDKWLKDRKGRPLSFDDLLHYQRVYIALAETRRVMAAIDARIGAWPIE